jgi:hypothetical protein
LITIFEELMYLLLGRAPEVPAAPAGTPAESEIQLVSWDDPDATAVPDVAPENLRWS